MFPTIALFVINVLTLVRSISILAMCRMNMRHLLRKMGKQSFNPVKSAAIAFLTVSHPNTCQGDAEVVDRVVL